MHEIEGEQLLMSYVSLFFQQEEKDQDLPEQ